MMDFLKANNKTIYVGILLILAVCLLLGYVPGMMSFSSWVTPPVALFLGLAFALLCGQAYPKFNKKAYRGSCEDNRCDGILLMSGSRPTHRKLFFCFICATS